MDELVRKQDVIDALHKEWDEVLVFDESGLTIANCCEDVINNLPLIKPNQYQEGYANGIHHTLSAIANLSEVELKERTTKVVRGRWGLDDECTCGKKLNGDECYCPSCGCRLEWE